MTASERRPIEPAQGLEFLQVALDEARIGLGEGGIPIGAALFRRDGTLLGRGHNRRVQEGDPSVHGETDAFRNAGRRRDYSDCVMVTTLSPCWFCSGLVRQFGIGAVVMGESENFSGGHGWLAENGVEVIDLADAGCIDLLSTFISTHHDLWFEDIGL
jgi:cytosine deaminase